MSIRIHPYISELNHARLKALARRPGQSESSIVNGSLDASFGSWPDSIGGHALLRRFDTLSRQIARLEQHDQANGETLALFIRYFMMIMPPVPADRQDAARAAGDLRFETFIDQLGIELQSGRRLLQRAIDTVRLDASDLYTEEQLNRLHIPAPEHSEGGTTDA